MPKERKRRTYGAGSIYQRKSDGRWCGTIEAGYTRTGGRRRITVTGRTEAEVKTKLKEKARDLARGEQAASSRTIVKAWSETWLAMTERTARPKTHTTDRGAVAAWIVPTIGHKRLDQLTPADVRAVDTAITGAGKSSTTALRYRGTLMRMLKAAVAEGHDIPPRVFGVRSPAKAVHDRQAIALPDALAVLAAASTRPDGTRWVAAFLQAMRQGECLGLTWEQVHDDALVISWQLQALPYRDKADRAKGFRIPEGYEAKRLDGALHLVRPKSRAGWRKIPLVPFLADSLEQWREVGPPSPHGLVWPRPDGRPQDPSEDRGTWRDLQDEAGVRHPSGRYYHLHEARHATATLLMELGVPETVRVAIMGHSTIASTRAYEHTDITLARDALAQVATRLQLR